MVGNWVQWGFQYKQNALRGRFPWGHPYVYRCYRITMFSIITDGKENGRYGCLALFEGMWIGQIWWACLFRMNNIYWMSKPKYGLLEKWALRFVEVRAERFKGIFGWNRGSINMAIYSYACRGNFWRINWLVNYPMS